MAAIKQIESGKWRVQIYVRGVRKSATFRTNREANAWASITENKVREAHSHRRDLEEKTGMKSSNVTAKEILEGRIPRVNFSGIYILFDDHRVMYVGQSKNILARIAAHSQNGRAFTSYFVIPCLECDLDATEQYYIDLLQPPENKTDLMTARRVARLLARSGSSRSCSSEDSRTSPND